MRNSRPLRQRLWTELAKAVLHEESAICPSVEGELPPEDQVQLRRRRPPLLPPLTTKVEAGLHRGRSDPVPDDRSTLIGPARDDQVAGPARGHRPPREVEEEGLPEPVVPREQVEP